MKAIDQITLEKLLTRVNKPYQYIGNEIFSYNKPFSEAKVRFALAFPDKYEIGASNLGHRVLYEAISRVDGALCDRVYAPEIDCKEALKELEIPLYGLETKVPLKEFDFLGFSLQYELCYTTVLAMLDMAKIPVKSVDRTDKDPIILAGGPCAYNPEPIRNFIDAFFIGDGEEVCQEAAKAFINAKNKGRAAILEILSKIDGIYVPSLHNGETINKRIYDFNRVPHQKSTLFRFQPRFMTVQ